METSTIVLTRRKERDSASRRTGLGRVHASCWMVRFIYWGFCTCRMLLSYSCIVMIVNVMS
jgi:hypothetical protein